MIYNEHALLYASYYLLEMRAKSSSIPTMRDVAARAGVSATVVSSVLSRKPNGVRVSQATADRVRLAAEELNYRLNVSAKNFRWQRSQTIGVLHGIGFARHEFDRGSRYFASLMDGMVDGAFSHDYAVTLCPKLMGSNSLDALGDGRFDGLVWYSASRTAELELVSIPLVILHATGEDFDFRRPTVICDNDQGIALAVRHLYDLGHRRIAFAAMGLYTQRESPLRLAAFQREMGQLGLATDQEDVINVERWFDDIDRYLAKPLRHTALIASTESLAADFINRAAMFGVRIPEDLSIVGFDSTSFCDELRPRLTAVRQPLKEMGRIAIDLLVKEIEREPVENRHMVVQCGFDIRESTRAI